MNLCYVKISHIAAALLQLVYLLWVWTTSVLHFSYSWHWHSCFETIIFFSCFCSWRAVNIMLLKDGFLLKKKKTLPGRCDEVYYNLMHISETFLRLLLVSQFFNHIPAVFVLFLFFKYYCLINTYFLTSQRPISLGIKQFVLSVLLHLFVYLKTEQYSNLKNVANY